MNKNQKHFMKMQGKYKSFRRVRQIAYKGTQMNVFSTSSLARLGYTENIFNVFEWIYNSISKLSKF